MSLIRSTSFGFAQKYYTSFLKYCFEVIVALSSTNATATLRKKPFESILLVRTLVTSIFSFSHNIFYPSINRDHDFGNICRLQMLWIRSSPKNSHLVELTSWNVLLSLIFIGQEEGEHKTTRLTVAWWTPFQETLC